MVDNLTQTLMKARERSGVTKGRRLVTDPETGKLSWAYVTDASLSKGGMATLVDMEILRGTIWDLQKSAGAPQPSGGGWEQGPRGGRRKKVGDKWVYDKGGEEKKTSAPTETDDAKNHEALTGALDKLPEGWKVTDTNGVTHQKKGGTWVAQDGEEKGKTTNTAAFIKKQTGGDSKKVGAMKMALWGFIQGLTPGKNPHWKMQLQAKAAGKPEEKAGKEAPEVKPAPVPEEKKPEVKPEGEKKPEETPEEKAKPEEKKEEPEPESEERQEEKKEEKKKDPPAKDEAKKAMLYLDVVDQMHGEEILDTASQVYLEKMFFKGGAVGGKYIRRVPYINAKGKKAYRYYYRDSAAARDVKEGEEVRLGDYTVKILIVDENGDITLRLDDGERKVTPDEWTGIMARHYGENFYAHAEKRARQTVNAVLRLVPKKLLEDLKGSTEAARMEDLRKRVPEVYEKLQAAFQRAGVNPFRAKRVIEQSLERRGWDPEARALVIGNTMTKEGAELVKEHRQILSAAENLAGGEKTELKHVAAALELRKPRGKDSTFAAKIADVAKAAEREIIKLQSLIKVARGKTGATAEVAAVLAQALAATNAHQLQMLKQAWPGIQDRAVEPVRETLMEVPSLAPRTAPKAEGAVSSFFYAGAEGRPQAMQAQYKLMEASDVIASHDPTAGFKKNASYPEGVQERVYHEDPNEQYKVRRNAQGLLPSFVVNTNPDAVNGPPIVTEAGVVLGGNSRVMSMQMAYQDHPDVAERLKKYMADHSHEVGLTSEDVAAMKNPVLVRVVALEDDSQTGFQRMVRAMNESFTQGMDPRTMQVALGRRLDKATLDTLAATMQAEDTLSSYLSASRSRPFIDALSKNGIIDDRNRNQYMVRGKGTLNADGKTLVARVLVGRMIGDTDVLSHARHKLVENLARSVPYMVRAQRFGPGYDLSDDLTMAVSALNEIQDKVDEGTFKAPSSSMTPVAFRELRNVFRKLPGIAEDHPILENQRALQLLEVLIRRPGVNQLAKVFQNYARQASHNPEGQGKVIGDVKTPAQVFNEAMSLTAVEEKAEAAAAEKKAPMTMTGLLGGMVEKEPEPVKVSEDNFETMPEGEKAPTKDDWGSQYGVPFLTPAGDKVYMHRKGQTVRFFSEGGAQVGPEQRNVAPGMAYAIEQGWKAEPQAVIEPESEPKPAPEEADAPSAAGRKYTYALTLRPVSTATVPAGFEEFGKHPTFHHGTVTYDAPLSAEDIEHFSLKQIPEVSDIDALVAATTDDFKEYASEYLEEEDPLEMLRPGIGQNIDESHLHLTTDQIKEVQERVVQGLRDAVVEEVPAPAPAPTPEPEESDAPSAAKLGVVVSADDIPMSLAVTASSGTSFSPERRAVQDRADYVATVDKVAALALKAAGNDPEKISQAKALVEDAAKGIRQRFMSMLASKSRVMSTMITGPSNFPVAQQRKRGDAADKKMMEMLAYVEQRMKKIQNTLNPRSISSDRSDAVAELETKLAKMEKDQKSYKAVNKIIRSKKLSEEEKVKQLAAIGVSEALFRQLMEPPYPGAQIGFESYLLTNNNANMKRVRERIAAVKKEQARPTTETAEDEGVTIIDNAEDNRVQLDFDKIPSEEIRSKLKSEGWRWSRRNSVWQRQRTENARYSAKRILAGLKKEAPAPGGGVMTKEELIQRAAKARESDG